jgi:8-oxo-dGTP pyrophosphatase MutT (NUDIX family)
MQSSANGQARAAGATVGGWLAQIEVVLVGRAWDHFWVLPKGTPLAGESAAEAALREVAEETGVTARIVGEIGRIHYWFSRQGTRYSKEVLYYLMEAVGGDVTLHDQEYDDAQWFPLADVPERLTYSNEAEIVRRAQSMLAGPSDSSATVVP